MSTPHITVRRSMVALDRDWLAPVAHALAHAASLEPAPSMSPGTARLAEFVSRHNGGDPRYARLGPIPPHAAGLSTDTDWLTSPRTNASPHAEFWEFDYGDVVHGHVAVSTICTSGIFPVAGFRDVVRCGTSSRHAPPPSGTVTAGGNNLDSLDDLTHSGWQNTVAMIADYLAGARHDLGALESFDAVLMSSAATIRAQSGPSLRDAVWNRDLPAPGTDIMYDLHHGDGLHATYRIYPKKRTNQ